MCEEKNENETLESIIFNEEGEITKKYETAEIELNNYTPHKVEEKTGIDYEIAKLMDLKRKKEFKRIFLEREIDELEYQIQKKIDNEVMIMKSQYKIAYDMIKDDYATDSIARKTNLKEKQINALKQALTKKTT